MNCGWMRRLRRMPDEHRPCPRCNGCGKIADGEEGAPWTFWLDLPLKSAVAVTAGLVRPIDCPSCGGSGEIGARP